MQHMLSVHVAYATTVFSAIRFHPYSTAVVKTLCGCFPPPFIPARSFIALCPLVELRFSSPQCFSCIRFQYVTHQLAPSGIPLALTFTSPSGRALTFSHFPSHRTWQPSLYLSSMLRPHPPPHAAT